MTPDTEECLASRASLLRLDGARQAFGFQRLAIELSWFDVTHDHQAHACVVGLQHHRHAVLLAELGHNLLQGGHHVFHGIHRIVVQQLSLIHI